VKVKKSSRKSDLVSIVVPVLNESENLAELYRQLNTILAELSYKFEILFVDDGSTDSTYRLLEGLRRKDERVKAVSFSRNFGHQAALTAGLQLARGNAVIMMDGDLQHPPALIPSLLKEWEAGFPIVYTVRKETQGESFFKKAASRMFYRLLNSFSDTPVHQAAADFRLLDRKVVASLNTFQERDRLLRGLISWVGFPSKSLVYTAEARAAGKSKYTLRKMVKLAIDGITSFSTAPLHLVTYVGFVVCLISFMYGLYSLYAFFFTGLTVPGWTSLLITVLFLGGVQLISIGIMGEYLIRVYNESKGRPLYIIKDSLGVSIPRSRT